MAINPIKTGSVGVKRCDKMRNRLLIGIDQGCSLTKVVYLNKKNKHQLVEETNEYVTFQWSLYNNDNFESVIRYIHEIAYIPEDSNITVHLTGAGRYSKCALLESIFGRKVEIIPEEMSIAAGIIIGLSRIKIETITKEIITPMSEEENINNPIRKLYLSQNKNMTMLQTSDADSLFPCLVLNYGSASGFTYINKDRKSEYLGLFFNGGKTLLGLAKCLLNTNNYPELMELARNGRRENIDLQIKDIIGANYKKIPEKFLDIPLFSFGKFDDLDFKLDDCKAEDMALSLVVLICAEIINYCARVASIKNISKVYLNGNLFQSSVFGRELQILLSTYPLQMTLVILDYGYAGALATMLCDSGDLSKYMNIYID